MTLSQRIEALLADKVDDSLLHRALVEVLFAAWEEMHRESAAIKAVLLDPKNANRWIQQREIDHVLRGGPCWNCREPLAAHRLEEEFGLVCPTDAAARTDDERFTYTPPDDTG